MSHTKKDSNRLNAAKALEASIHTSSGPLGHSADDVQHYIRPVPPTYVTEYESSYTWPKVASYAPDPDRVHTSAAAARGGGAISGLPTTRTASATTAISTTDPAASAAVVAATTTDAEEDAIWAEAEKEIDSMLHLNRKRNMIDGDAATVADELHRATREHQPDNKQLNGLYNRAKRSVTQHEETHHAHALNKQFVKTMDQIVKPS